MEFIFYFQPKCLSSKTIFQDLPCGPNKSCGGRYHNDIIQFYQIGNTV